MRAAWKRVGSLCFPALLSLHGEGWVLCLSSKTASCDHHSSPIYLFPFFMGKCMREEITKGFPGHFLLCADKKRQND